MSLVRGDLERIRCSAVSALRLIDTEEAGRAALQAEVARLKAQLAEADQTWFDKLEAADAERDAATSDAKQCAEYVRNHADARITPLTLAAADRVLARYEQTRENEQCEVCGAMNPTAKR